MADQTFTITEGIKAGLLDMLAHANQKAGNAAGTDWWYIPNDGKVVLFVTSTAATSAINFTPVVDKFGRTESLQVTPTTLRLCVIGPFNPAVWNQPNGCVAFKPAAGVATDHYLAVRVGTPT
jgi:hypothetical protein